MVLGESIHCCLKTCFQFFDIVHTFSLQVFTSCFIEVFVVDLASGKPRPVVAHLSHAHGCRASLGERTHRQLVWSVGPIVSSIAEEECELAATTAHNISDIESAAWF